MAGSGVAETPAVRARPAAALLVAALAAAACGGESVLSGASTGPASTTTAPASTSTTPPTTAGGFPEPVVEAYLEGCASGPEERSYCLCTVREFEERLTLEEFLALGTGEPAGGVVLEVTEVCLAEAGASEQPRPTASQTPVPETLRAYTDATIEALDDYWATALPDTYSVVYRTVADTVPYFPSSGGLPDCGPDPLPPEVYSDNAFYCSVGDFVAWDAEGLMPGLYAEFGDFAVALVLAHEWGHAVQARAGVDGLTIMTELQADCFAGAWTAHIDAGGSPALGLQPGDLDEAMAGYLLFRDPPGTSPGDPQAHGSAFDRVNAFREGFAGGPSTCAGYEDGGFLVVDIPLTQEDLVTGGDLPYAQTAPLLAATLEAYWSAVFPVLFGAEYPPMTDYGPYVPSSGVLPTCGDLDLRPEDYEGNAFYCPDGDYVAWDDENLLPYLWQEIGDFAVGMVLAHEWATGAQSRAGIAVDGVDASLQADCFAGSWTAAMVQGIPIVLDDGTETAIVLSAGDLDEAVAGFLVFGDDPGAALPSAGSAFDRFDAFRQGFFEGAERCLAFGP